MSQLVQDGYAIMKMSRHYHDSQFVCLAKTRENAVKKAEQLTRKTRKIHWIIPAMKVAIPKSQKRTEK